MSSSGLSRDQLLDMYYKMVLIRHFEEKCKDLYQEGKIGGAYLHLYSGQEATGVGALSAIKDSDHVITAYRDHGMALLRGLDPGRLMAEMFGKRTGVSGGKGGSMHLADPTKRYWGGYGIVGGHLPIAAGIALRVKYMHEPDIVIAFLGDGASNNGYFHEALNMSAVLDLPIVWVIENNLYGMGTRVELASGQVELVKKAVAYGMQEGGRVDGMDVFSVYRAVTDAAEYARAHGPILMESITYRYDGHGMSDKMYTQRAEELSEQHARDPIERMRTALIEEFSDDIVPQLDELVQKVDQVVADAVEFADQSPVPTVEDLMNHVYVD